MSDSYVAIVGNVTREPELRFTNTGQAVVSFGVAVNKRWMNKQTNEWQEETSFFDVVAWRELAENIAESLPKGSRVMVSGALQQRSWEDKDSGEKRYKIEIVADEVGPSLRWATASLTRNEKGGSSNGNGGGRSTGQAEGYGHSEEPF